MQAQLEKSQRSPTLANHFLKLRTYSDERRLRYDSRIAEELGNRTRLWKFRGKLIFNYLDKGKFADVEQLAGVICIERGRNPQPSSFSSELYDIRTFDVVIKDVTAKKIKEGDYLSIEKLMANKILPQQVLLEKTLETGHYREFKEIVSSSLFNVEKENAADAVKKVLGNKIKTDDKVGIGEMRKLGIVSDSDVSTAFEEICEFIENIKTRLINSFLKSDGPASPTVLKFQNYTTTDLFNEWYR